MFLGVIAVLLLVSSTTLIVVVGFGIGLGNDPAWVSLHPDEYREAVLKEKHRSDPMLALYRDRGAKEDVVAFFTAVLNSEELAKVILKRAEEYDVSPSLAAAIGWEESRFDPAAVNRNKASVDRGLFQLNSKSFPKLQERDFFNPDVNARFGIAHLRWCLDLGGSEVSGLAMYNAGTTRVRADNTPKKTLDYIARVLAFRDGLDALFTREVGSRWLVDADGGVRSLAVRRTTENLRTASALFPLLNGGSR
jgi:soluble lytic murein transglycosylase-like protein